ncbi:Transposase [compost metagenome]
MSTSYSLDLRRVAVARFDEGLSAEDVGAMLDIHPNTIRRWVKQRDTRGTLENRPHGGGHTPKLIDEDRQRLRELHEADTDAYLRELVERLAEATGKRVSIHTVDRELRKMGITRKKNTSKQPNKTRLKSKRHDKSS